MNLLAILRNSWFITWRTGSLWLLTVLMLVTFLPVGVLTLAFSAVANLASFDDPTLTTLLNTFPQTQDLDEQIQAASMLRWIGLAVVALVALVGATTLSLIIQAASMRGVVRAAEGNQVSLRAVLSLGRARTFNIFKLSSVFGLVIALLGVLPTLALLWVGKSAPVGVALIHLVQTGLTPVTLFLNLLLLLLIMSIALEDFTPRAAFGRAGNVFKKGWWAFLLVIGLSGVAVFVSFAIFVIPPFVVMPLVFFDPTLGVYATLGTLACGGLFALFFFIFTVVFTQALYALVYREAARLTGTQ